MKYKTVKELSEEYPISQAYLRLLIKNEKDFKKCVRRLGRKVLINVEEFEKWLEKK